MKKLLLSLTLLGALLIFSYTVKAQTNIYFEDFTSGVVPTDFFIGGGAQVKPYNNPANNCTLENGLQTPGIGGSNPTKVILPAKTFDNTNKFVTVSFNLFVFDANLNCASSKTFPCPTFVKVSLVKGSFTSTNTQPTASDVYASSEYQLVNANGSNTITFTDLQTASIANGVSFRVVLDFKSVNNCNQGNTKYVIDGLSISKDVCAEGGCAPYANNDYFLFGEAGFLTNILSANVFGGFTLWETDGAAISYPEKSLQFGTAVNNGLDGDNNNHGLSQMNFALVTPLTIGTSSCVIGTPNPGTLTFNTNGTFTYVKGDICVQSVYFTYRITDPTGFASGIARVTIDLVDNVILPVTYKSFNATRSSNNQVVLEWETALEENNRGFYVQRLVNGEWKNIGFVFTAADKGNSTSALKYAFKDANSSKGITQYRILQVDMDGKGRYSEVRSIRGEEMAARLTIFPNPSNTGAFSLLFEDATSVRDVIVSDVSGRQVKQIRGISSNSISVAGLNNGFYTVQVVNHTTGAITVEKVIIKKR